MRQIALCSPAIASHGEKGRGWQREISCGPFRTAVAQSLFKFFHFQKTPAIISFFAAVAQLDRVLGYEPRGRGFDSCQPHQTYKGSIARWALLSFWRMKMLAEKTSSSSQCHCIINKKTGASGTGFFMRN
jgi:hypothetical protein